MYLELILQLKKYILKKQWIKTILSIHMLGKLNLKILSIKYNDGKIRPVINKGIKFS